MKKGVKVFGLIAVLIAIGSLFVGIVSTEVIVADVNKDIAATNVNVTPSSPKDDLELVRGDYETDTSTKNKTERIKVTPIPISKPTLKPRPTPRPKPTSTHDMVVTNVNTTPSSPDLEQPTVIYVTVTNEGKQQEDNVSVKVYVDSTQIGTTQYISLAPGSSNTTTFLWTPTTAKTYSVKGEVGIVNGEIDIKDNTKSIKVRVSAVPTPMPGTPSNPSPSNHSTDVYVNTNLDWSDCSNTDYYDLYFGTSSPPPPYGSAPTSTTPCYPFQNDLEYGTKYYWKIEAKNNCGGNTSGPIWDFDTEEAPNQLPTAIIDPITPDPAEQGTDTVSFTGHGTDTDGTVVAYNWSSSIDGPLSTLAAFTKPASELSVGTHTIYFKVQDNDGAWSTEDTVDLTIYPANVPPTAIIDSITPDPAVQGTDTVSFSGHGTDPDGTVAAYNWSSSIDGPLSTSAAFTKPASELSVGTHTIYFKVQDDDGTWSTEDTADLTINPANQQPTAIIDSITPDPAEQGTDTVSFSGHGTDTDGTVEAYNWSSSIDGPLSTSAAFTKPASELSVGTHTIYFKVQDDDGTWSTEDTEDLTIYPGPELSYSPESHDFCDMREGKTDNTTFEIWNSGTDTLTYSLSETCDWLEVHPTSGSSTGEHNSITVDMDTTGLFEGSHTCDITINSNDGSGTFTVMVNVVPCPCGNKGVNPTSWSPTLNCGESNSQIVTVSASDCIVNGVTVSKISGPTWLSVSQTDLGDIASGSSETFTVTAAPPAGTSSGDYPYTIRVSNTCGTPSTRDVAGTINVNENADGQTDYWAVIVGVADYTGTSYDLAYTDDDAIDLYNMLLLSGDYWQPDHIKLLLDSEADRAGILAAFDWLDDNEDPDDVVLFFFSGHGTYDVDDDGDELDGWDEFFCPYDFNNIRDDELDAELDRLGSTSIAVIMDTCFAGGMTKDSSVKTLPKQKVELTDGFAKDIQDEKKDMGDVGRVVLMACDDDEYSYEIYELENGLFSYYVIEGLERSADAEGNGDNICSAEETFVYAEPRVVDIISTQNPQLYDGYTGELPITRPPCPELSYSPTSHDFGDKCEGVTDSTTFELWNSGTGTLTYSLSETCDWLDVQPTSGSSTGEHDTITVDIDTTSLFEGFHTCDITINSNDGSGTFTVMVNGVSCPCGNMGVNPTSWSPTLNCSESDNEIVTVSATGGTVRGVTGSKVSGPTWLSVSPTDLGDIASGSSKTFTMTTSPPPGISGDFPYTVTVSNTCGTPSTRDVAGTIHVDYLESSWTFMIYLDGDNNLESAAIVDFMEMSAVGSTSAVNIVVQFDRIPGGVSSYGDWTDCKRFHVTSGMTPMPENATEDLGECNMGDPNTLDAFVTWAMTKFPADNYALVLWDHGDGWKSINGWVPWADDIKDAKDAGVSRGICWDVTNGWDSLTLQETEQAMTGKYVQLLGYDACLMHMVEVVYQVMANAGVSVGSEEVEPGDGWPYNTILADLTVTPTMNENALATVIVDRYMASYPTPNDLTQSAMDNSALPNLVAAVDNLAQALINEINGGHVADVQQARYAAEEIYYTYYIDLYHFAEMVQLYVPGAAAQAQAVMNEVSKMYEAHGSSVPNDHGLSIYFPQVEGDYLPSYDNTAFAIDTEWDEFLKRYYAPTICGNMNVNPTSWSPTLNCGESDNEIVTVSASDGIVNGVTVSKVSGPTWLSVSQTDLGDIASGSSKTFTMTSSPPPGISGDFPYTVTVSNTCGTPSTRDVAGTIHVDYLESSWTFMIYLDGDNNLESAAIGDFLEMSAVGSTSDVNIVVQFDRIPGYASSYGDWRDCKRFHVTAGMTPTAANATEDLGECNMGDPNTLDAFVTWAMTNFPADNYALILWNHGDGWKSINKWVPWADDIKDAKDAGVSRGICWDITNNDYLSLQETEVALTGKYVQLLGYDACLMHMVEVVYQVMANAGVSVGSEEVEPGDGWPYDTILADLTVTPTMNEDALGTVIVDRYMASYPTYNDLTQSAMDNSALPNLVAAVDNLAQALMTEINGGHVADVQQARNAAEEIYYNYYIDLYHFAEMVDTYVPGAAAQAQAVMNEVSGSVYEAHGSSVPNDHGLSIYFPRVEGDYLASYDNTAFASDTEWDEFLKKYYNPPTQGGDICVFRNGRWWVSKPDHSGTDYSFNYGIPGDIPVVGDVNNDGVDDVVIFRNGKWWVSKPDHSGTDYSFNYGIPGDIPVVGDVNNDGVDDVVIFRNGKWWVSKPDHTGTDYSFNYGIPGDIPVIGDVNNDGVDDVVIFRNGKWWVSKPDHTGTDYSFNYGIPGDIPVVGDVNNDGVDDVVIFRNGKWWVSKPDHTGTDYSFNYGIPGDIPVVGDI